MDGYFCSAILWYSGTPFIPCILIIMIGSSIIWYCFSGGMYISFGILSGSGV